MCLVFVFCSAPSAAHTACFQYHGLVCFAHADVDSSGDLDVNELLLYVRRDRPNLAQ